MRWTLEEIGADYEYVKIDLARREHRQPAFLAINPAGKVPVLEIDGLVLTESAAICRTLADRFPAAELIPAVGTVHRALCEQWCDFAISELEQPLWLISRHTEVLPEAERLPAVIPLAEREFARTVAILAAGLGEQDFILGEDFSVADILLGHTLAWARAVKLPLGGPHVEAYAKRVLARPALDQVRTKNRS